MTNLCIIGGQLQGMEAVYLARQAGFSVTLIDKDPQAPAGALADDFFHLDILRAGERGVALLKKYDLILPATENYHTLAWLQRMTARSGIPLALDLAAYDISSSKLASNLFFARNGIAMPQPWPECGLPVIVKPSGLSGSAGVVKVSDWSRLGLLLESMGGDAVIQQYLEGPSYSLEVLAHRGECRCLQVTELNFDAGYDCKRVLAGPATGTEVAEAFCVLGERIVSALGLSGIMDIEVIAADGELKVLEIDARLPSQTPSAVFHSTGVNMVELLADYWVHGRLPEDRPLTGAGAKAVIYEHLRFKKGVLEVAGEHVLAGARGLEVYHDRFLADVMISNFANSPEDWVATVIYIEETEAQVWETRNRAMKNIAQAFKAAWCLDPQPYDERGAGVDQIIL